jgi:hypothetical protein
LGSWITFCSLSANKPHPDWEGLAGSALGEETKSVVHNFADYSGFLKNVKRFSDFRENSLVNRSAASHRGLHRKSGDK